MGDGDQNNAINNAVDVAKEELKFRSMVAKEILSLLKDPKLPLYVKVFAIVVTFCILAFSLIAFFALLDWITSLFKEEAQFRSAWYLSAVGLNVGCILIFAIPVLKFSASTEASERLKDRLIKTHGA